MGLNDIGILTGIISFFLLLGFITPFINSEFNTNYESHSSSELTPDDNNLNSISAWKVLISVASIFVWNLSGLPLIINIFLFIPRIILFLIIGRNIWIGGGA